MLLAGFSVLLHRYTGQHDLAVGSVFSGRTRSEIEPMVGFFVNTLVLRTSVAGDPTFRELVGRSNETVLGAMAHQDVPFGLVDALQPERAAGRNPLFQISLTLQTGATASANLTLDGTRVESVRIDGTGAFRPDHRGHRRARRRARMRVEHSTELFDADRIVRMIEPWASCSAGGGCADTRIARAVAARPRRARSRRTAVEPHRAQLRTDGLLHQLVDRHAVAAPGPGGDAVRRHRADLRRARPAGPTGWRGCLPRRAVGRTGRSASCWTARWSCR